ncbi:MAG: hypothetical protein JW940_39265 [Polyangiaceae bacterium]|nr:hypothetical protein [Polyangiaceae bacterium]
MLVRCWWLMTAATVLIASGAAAQPSGAAPNPADQHCSLGEMCPSGTMCKTGVAGSKPSFQYVTCARRAYARGLVRRCSHLDKDILTLLLCPRGQAGSWPGSRALAKAELAEHAQSQPVEPTTTTTPPAQATPNAPRTDEAHDRTAERASSGPPAETGPRAPTKPTSPPPSPGRTPSCSTVHGSSSHPASSWLLWAVMLAVTRRRRAAVASGAGFGKGEKE